MKITLTIAHEIIGQSGQILFTEGQKVKVEKFDVKEAYWGKGSGIHYPAVIEGVRLQDHHGIWFARAFREDLQQFLDTKYKKYHARKNKI